MKPLQVALGLVQSACPDSKFNGLASKSPCALSANHSRIRPVHNLVVKTRLVIHAFPEQFRAFFIPFLEGANRRFMLERPL